MQNQQSSLSTVEQDYGNKEITSTTYNIETDVSSNNENHDFLFPPAPEDVFTLQHQNNNYNHHQNNDYFNFINEQTLDSQYYYLTQNHHHQGSHQHHDGHDSMMEFNSISSQFYQNQQTPREQKQSPSIINSKTEQVATGQANEEEVEFEEMDIPKQIIEMMDEAATGNVSKTTHYSTILFEEDKAAIQEIDEELGTINLGLGNKGRRKKKNKTKFKKSTILNQEQAYIMGQANSLYAQGQYKEAIVILKSLLSQVPGAHEPWLTLGTIYDELGDDSKSMGCFFMAAHMTPKDVSLWRKLSQSSLRVGLKDQAIYCLNKVISLEPNDVDSIWDRSMLFKELGKIRKTMEGFESILNIIPFNIQAIKELASIHMDLEQPDDAIILFESALLADRESPIVEELEPDLSDDVDDDDDNMFGSSTNRTNTKTIKTFRIGYVELSTLCDLYLQASDHEKAIGVIQECIVRLSSDKYQQSDNAKEIDIKHLLPDVPLEIVVKLAVCQIYQGEYDSSKSSVGRLLESHLPENSDLFYLVADAYLECGQYGSALVLLDRLMQNEETDTPKTWIKMGRVYQMMGSSDAAINLYEAVLEVNPSELDVKLYLAQVYEDQGKVEMALKLLQEIDEQSKMTKDDQLIDPTSLREQNIMESEEDENLQQESALATNKSHLNLKKQRKAGDGIAAKAAEQNLLQQTQIKYKKLISVFPNILDKVKLTDCLRVARYLLNRFHASRNFYPSERSKIYIVSSKVRQSQQVNETIARLNSMMTGNVQPTSVVSILSSWPENEPFRGLLIEEWRDVFVKTAAAYAIEKRADEAYAVLKSALESTVLSSDEASKFHWRMHVIASAIVCEDHFKVFDTCRWFVQQMPLYNDPYRLMTVCLTGGAEALRMFASSITQKYLLRQVKLMEKAFRTVYHKYQGQSQQENAILYTMYGHVLSCARSYVLSLEFYSKAYKLAPKDPIINLSLGISYLHRAMQRKSENRHEQVMMGMSFIFQYYELCNESDSAAFNVARALHQIGLTHLAIPYYEKVLLATRKSKEDFGLSREAAYNLSLIYISNQSPALAQSIMKEYCTI